MYKAEFIKPVITDPKGLLPVALTILLGACATNPALVSPADSSTTPAKHKPAISALAAQQITGHLVSNNGRTPVAGATIYLANRKGSTSEKSMLGNTSLNTATSSHECAAPTEPHFVYTCTQADGSFELPVAQISAPLIASKEEIRSEIKLDLNDIGTDIGLITLKQTKDMPVENIAIVLDFFDPYDDISNQLNTSQLDPEAAFLVINDQLSEVLDPENPNQHIDFPKFASLFEDNDGDNQADIFNYSSIYINSRDADGIAKMDKNQKKQVLKFIATGGELYVTEWTIETPEPSLDQYI